ncbi:Rv3654c family TadE-like protein [Haloechinothrix salitolerans]|uniref:Rv3654c family TadE-like protein n=1 Tax=Haloechinothrix salitolerans TaxID=926830 RepID=A0ABW2BUT6_9PSEU
MTRVGRQYVGGGGDHGIVTVWTAGVAFALLAVFAMLIYLGAATHARHRAAATADLAALGAAVKLNHGTRHACEAAALVARRMKVDLVSCQVRGWDVLVTVQATAGWPLGDVGGAGEVTARARAGSVEAVR